MRRFPTRTIILMVVALVAFFFMRAQTQASRERLRQAREPGSSVTIVPLPAPLDAGAGGD